MTIDREPLPEQPNPLGLDGIEFVEYATLRPQALGQVLETMGFRPIARHRSREVMLYRQGNMNLVVNAHPDDARASATEGGHPVLSAVAFRVRDATSTSFPSPPWTRTRPPWQAPTTSAWCNTLAWRAARNG